MDFFIFAANILDIFIYDYLFKARLPGLSLSTETSHLCSIVVFVCAKESDKSKIPVRSF
jgi:hypothetical protein